MQPVVHSAASRKGGGVRKRKGFASLTPERRKQIASMGGTQNAKNHKDNKGTKPEKVDTSNGGAVLADILGALDEEEL